MSLDVLTCLTPTWECFVEELRSRENVSLYIVSLEEFFNKPTPSSVVVGRVSMIYENEPNKKFAFVAREVLPDMSSGCYFIIKIKMFLLEPVQNFGLKRGDRVAFWNPTMLEIDDKLSKAKISYVISHGQDRCDHMWCARRDPIHPPSLATNPTDIATGGQSLSRAMAVGNNCVGKNNSTENKNSSSAIPCNKMKTLEPTIPSNNPDGINDLTPKLKETNHVEKEPAKRPIDPVNPSYNYQTLADVKSSRHLIKVNTFCVVLKILKSLCKTQAGKFTVIIEAVDPTMENDETLKIHFFTIEDTILKEISQGDVLRLHRLQMEIFGDGTDGRIFNSTDITLFKHSSSDFISVAKKTLVTESERTKAEELKTWFQEKYINLLLSDAVSLSEIASSGSYKLFCKALEEPHQTEEGLKLGVSDGTVIRNLSPALSLVEGRPPLVTEISIWKYKTALKSIKMNDYVLFNSVDVEQTDCLTLNISHENSNKFVVINGDNSRALEIERLIKENSRLPDEELEFVDVMESDDLEPLELYIDVESDNMEPLELNNEMESDNMEPLELKNDVESDNMEPLELNNEVESDNMEPLESNNDVESDNLEPLELSNDVIKENSRLPDEELEFVDVMESDDLEPLELNNEMESDNMEPLELNNEMESDNMEPLELNNEMESDNMEPLELNNDMERENLIPENTNFSTSSKETQPISPSEEQKPCNEEIVLEESSQNESSPENETNIEGEVGGCEKPETELNNSQGKPRKSLFTANNGDWSDATEDISDNTPPQSDSLAVDDSAEVLVPADKSMSSLFEILKDQYCSPRRLPNGQESPAKHGFNLNCKRPGEKVDHNENSLGKPTKKTLFTPNNGDWSEASEEVSENSPPLSGDFLNGGGAEISPPSDKSVSNPFSILKDYYSSSQTLITEEPSLKDSTSGKKASRFSERNNTLDKSLEQNNTLTPSQNEQISSYAEGSLLNPVSNDDQDDVSTVINLSCHPSGVGTRNRMRKIVLQDEDVVAEELTPAVKVSSWLETNKGNMRNEEDEELNREIVKSLLVKEDDLSSLINIPIISVRVFLESVLPNPEETPFDLVSGFCKDGCQQLYRFSTIDWEYRGAEIWPFCPACNKLDKSMKLTLEFMFELVVFDISGSYHRIIVFREQAEFFFNCSPRNYLKDPSQRERCIRTLMFFTKSVDSKRRPKIDVSLAFVKKVACLVETRLKLPGPK